MRDFDKYDKVYTPAMTQDPTGWHATINTRDGKTFTGTGPTIQDAHAKLREIVEPEGYKV